MTTRAWVVLILLWLAIPLAGCNGAPRTLYGKSIDGQVVEADTGQPIAGAYVLYLWQAGPIPTGFAVHNSSDICYHAASAVTDAQGRYHIPPWSKPQKYNVPNVEPSAWAYAKGYVLPRELTPPEGPMEEPVAHLNDVLSMQRSHAVGDERLEELWNVIRRTCPHGGASQRDGYPVLKAAYDEAKKIAITNHQLQELRSFASVVAMTWTAPDPLGDATPAEQQSDRFIRENL